MPNAMEGRKYLRAACYLGSMSVAEPLALKFQAAMMSNDWLCDSTVGHEVGTCLGCITVALRVSGIDALSPDETRLLAARDALMANRDNPELFDAFPPQEVLDAALDLARCAVTAYLAEPQEDREHRLTGESHAEFILRRRREGLQPNPHLTDQPQNAHKRAGYPPAEPEHG